MKDFIASDIDLCRMKSLYLSGVFTEPFLLLIVQVRRSDFVHFLVIVVQHGPFFRCHDFRLDGIQVERNEGDRFQPHELAEFVGHIVYNQQLVLQTDAVGTFYVEARLVGDNHALFQNGGVAFNEAGTEAGRTFVDVQQVTHAVAGAVVVVHASLPERVPGQVVQRNAGDALGEDRIAQGQVADGNDCEVFLHLLSDRSEDVGSGDISGTFPESGARVCEQHAFRLQFCIGLRGRCIVDDRRMLRIGGNRLEARLDEIPHFCPELIQLVGSADLGDADLSYIFFQPFHEAT